MTYKLAMRHILLLCFLFCLKLHAQQPPEGISYQGVALNSAGTPLPAGSPVGLRISILSGTPSGSVDYTETLTVTTGAQGVYSIIIGQSNVNSFSNIQWDTENKFLKIELDPLGGSSYSQTGISQLMSVPYAFHTKFTKNVNSHSITNTMADLRSKAGKPNDVIYLKGYYTSGDGGEGYFIWKTDSIFLSSSSGLYKDDNGGTIIKVTNNDTGRWVRQYEGYINVFYFGATGTWGNYTQQIQSAINFAKLTSDGNRQFFKSTTVFIPSGNYVIDKLILKDGVSIIGESIDKTILYSSNSPDAYLVTMDAGRIRLNMSNLNFIGAYGGNSNSSKGVFFFQATGQSYDTGMDGGLQNSTFKNIQISNFNGHGIYLKATTNQGVGYKNHNNYFENVKITKGSTSENSSALKVDELNDNLTFTNCHFSGGSWAVYSYGSIIDLKGSLGGLFIPQNISFINSVIENGDIGLNLSNASSITANSCTFQYLGIAVKADGSIQECKGINIINNKFFDAAGYGTYTPGTGHIKDNGYCISTKKSFLNVRGNYFISAAICNSCGFLYSDTDNLGVALEGNSFLNSSLNRTVGVTKSVTQTGSTLECGQHSYIKAQSSTGNITTLNSTVNTGEFITIEASFLANLVFAKTGNISFPGTRATFTLSTGQVARFRKMDISGQQVFHLVSYVKSNL